MNDVEGIFPSLPNAKEFAAEIAKAVGEAVRNEVTEIWWAGCATGSAWGALAGLLVGLAIGGWLTIQAAKGK